MATGLILRANVAHTQHEDNNPDLLALNARDGSIAWSYYYWFSWVESTAVVLTTPLDPLRA